MPKVTQILEDTFSMKGDLGVHLNGDEAMCFGSAFVATNSSSNFKVKKIYLTQALPFDVQVQIAPLGGGGEKTDARRGGGGGCGTWGAGGGGGLDRSKHER